MMEATSGGGGLLRQNWGHTLIGPNQKVRPQFWRLSCDDDEWCLLRGLIHRQKVVIVVAIA